MLTVDELKTMIASNTVIDRERIHAYESPHKVIINIDACTENEQILAQSLLHSKMPVTIAWEVLRREIPEKTPLYGLSKLRGILEEFSKAPHSQLDKRYAAQCGVFAKERHNLEETLEFIRNTRDWCVFTSGASEVIMTFWNLILQDYPEHDGVRELRRAKLNAILEG